MSVLGQPSRVTYQAVAGRSGLQDVMVSVTAPDGTLEGVYPMNEYTETFLHGVYYYDVMTTLNSLSGTYTCVVVSPSEGQKIVVAKEINAPLDLSLLQSLVTALMPVNLTGIVSQSKLMTGHLLPSPHLKGEIQNSTITGSVYELP